MDQYYYSNYRVNMMILKNILQKPWLQFSAQKKLNKIIWYDYYYCYHYEMLNGRNIENSLVLNSILRIWPTRERKQSKVQNRYNYLIRDKQINSIIWSQAKSSYHIDTFCKVKTVYSLFMQKVSLSTHCEE